MKYLRAHINTTGIAAKADETSLSIRWTLNCFIQGQLSQISDTEEIG